MSDAASSSESLPLNLSTLQNKWVQPSGLCLYPPSSPRNNEMSQRGRGSKKDTNRQETWSQVANQLIKQSTNWQREKESTVFTLNPDLSSYACLFYETVSFIQSKSQPCFKTLLNHKAALMIPASPLFLWTSRIPISWPLKSDAALFFFSLISVDIHVFSPLKAYVPSVQVLCLILSPIFPQHLQVYQDTEIHCQWATDFF